MRYLFKEVFDECFNQITSWFFNENQEVVQFSDSSFVMWSDGTYVEW